MDSSVNYHDIYEHADEKLFYSPVNIPGPGADLSLFESQFEGCSCEGNCDKQCLCKSRGVNDVAKCLENPNSENLIYECHDNCLCNSHKNCDNRLTQKGPLPNLYVFYASEKGCGLRSADDIRRHTFVCEYAGEVIGSEEARRRFALQQEKDSNYIFALREHFGSKQLVTYIDPTFVGNIGRYINHSCNPNLMIVVVRTGTPVPRLCLFANKDIEAFTELSFDYGGDEVNGTSVERCLGKRKTCLCGDEKCRKFLPYDASLV